jgi:hypothetical protein
MLVQLSGKVKVGRQPFAIGHILQVGRLHRTTSAFDSMHNKVDECSCFQWNKLVFIEQVNGPWMRRQYYNSEGKNISPKQVVSG